MQDGIPQTDIYSTQTKTERISRRTWFNVNKWTVIFFSSNTFFVNLSSKLFTLLTVTKWTNIIRVRQRFVV